MNFPLLTAILQSDLPPLQRLLLLVLLNHANQQGRAWPSHATLSRETGLVKRSVGEHMRSLEAAGWIVRTGNVGRVNVFALACPTGAVPASALPSAAHEARDASPTRQGMPHLPPATRQAVPHDEAGDSTHAARTASSCGTPCLLTTQEPLINHPENHPIMEEGRPPPRGLASSYPQKSKTSSKKPDWRAWNRDEAEKANAVTSAQQPPREFAEAWQRYRDYRTRRATEARVASEAVRWTADAAEAALRSCERHARTQGWMAVVAQIDAAIAGQWQGLNFPAPGAFGSTSGSRSSASPWSRRYSADTATEGLTPEEVLSFMPPHLVPERR